MTRRKWLATGILALWLCGLGLLALHELYPNEEKRRANIARLIEPFTYYYEVTRDGEHVGYATSQLDTTLLGVRLRTASVQLGAREPDSMRISAQFEATLTPRLRIADFEVVLIVASERRFVIGRTLGDTALELEQRQGARSPADTIPFTRHAVTPEVAPLLIALGNSPAVGQIQRLDLFDRGSLSIATAALRIEAESLFTVADSASLNSASGRYEVARSDTVRAWRVTIDGEGGGIVWFDHSGRIVEHEPHPGLVLRRTAFELAFDNWRLGRESGRDPESPPHPDAFRSSIPDRSAGSAGSAGRRFY